MRMIARILRKIVEIRKQGNAGSLGYVSFIGWIATRVTIGADHTVEGGGSLKPESRIHRSAQQNFCTLLKFITLWKEWNGWGYEVVSEKCTVCGYTWKKKEKSNKY